MYIKNGDVKIICTDFNGSNSDERILFYLNSSPEFSDDEIGLYTNDDFCMKIVKRSDYKNETISEFGGQYLLTLSNEDIVEEKENIDEVKANKITEMSKETQQNIINGFDLDIDGEIKHFSLESHDQQNIIAICQYLDQNEDSEGYLYHADNEELTLYSRENMNLIRDKMIETIMNNISTYHTIKKKITDATSIDEINKISF